MDFYTFYTVRNDFHYVIRNYAHGKTPTGIGIADVMAEHVAEVHPLNFGAVERAAWRAAIAMHDYAYASNHMSEVDRTYGDMSEAVSLWQVAHAREEELFELLAAVLGYDDYDAEDF